MVPEPSSGSSSGGGGGGSSASIKGTAYWAFSMVKPVATSWMADSYLQSITSLNDIDKDGIGRWVLGFESPSLTRCRSYTVATDGTILGWVEGLHAPNLNDNLEIYFDLKKYNSDVWAADISKIDPLFGFGPMFLSSSSSGANLFKANVTNSKYPSTVFVIQMLPSYKVTKN